MKRWLSTSLSHQSFIFHFHILLQSSSVRSGSRGCRVYEEGETSWHTEDTRTFCPHSIAHISWDFHHLLSINNVARLGCHLIKGVLQNTEQKRGKDASVMQNKTFKGDAFLVDLVVLIKHNHRFFPTDSQYCLYTLSHVPYEAIFVAGWIIIRVMVW